MGFRDVLRLPGRRQRRIRRYAERDPSASRRDPRAAVSGDSLRVTIEVSVESLIQVWARNRGVPLEQARRDFKTAVRDAVTPEMLQPILAEINSAIGGEPLHYITARVI